MQYERGLWPCVLKQYEIKAGGFSFPDDDIDKFYSVLYSLMQQRMKEVRRINPLHASELSVASSILGRPSGEKISLPSTNFRKDLKIICEAAGVRGCRLILSDDSRFIDTVIESSVVFQCFKTAMNKALGITFRIRVEALSSVLQSITDP